MYKYFGPSSSVGPSNIPTSTPNSLSKKARTEVLDADIVGPALRKPIEDYTIEMRDTVRRRYVTQGACRPRGHTFPKTKIGSTNRSFLESWFSKYDWLEYSVSKDAAFCFLCFLFGKGEISSRGGDVFTKRGFSNWKDATRRFRNLVGGVTSPHNDVRILYEGFKNQNQSVTHMLASHTRATDAAYRTRLTTTVNAIRYLIKNRLAFRGHDESEHSLRKGNFLELIEYNASLNEEIRNAIASAPGNNQLTCPSIKREIVSACATETRKAILEDIGDKCFSLLIDEAQDCSIKEQMAIVLRYVNSHGEVIERFVGVVHVSNTYALSLKCAIDDFFANNGLSLSRLRGQGYDGASNMRGELNGLKILILNENPYAKYIHCFAHRLQLVVVAVAGANCDVSDCFEYIFGIINLVGASCKRKDDLRLKQHDHLVAQLHKND